jgi:hypothetical protein
MADAHLIIPSPPLPLNKATTAMPRTHPHVQLLLLQLSSSQIGGTFTQCLEEDMSTFPLASLSRMTFVWCSMSVRLHVWCQQTNGCFNVPTSLSSLSKNCQLTLVSVDMNGLQRMEKPRSTSSREAFLVVYSQRNEIWWLAGFCWGTDCRVQHLIPPPPTSNSVYVTSLSVPPTSWFESSYLPNVEASNLHQKSQ